MARIGQTGAIGGKRADRIWSAKDSKVWDKRGGGIDLKKAVERGGTPVYRWQDCSTEEFERVWMPKFMAGENPQDAPIVSVIMPEGTETRGRTGGWV